MKLGIAVSSGTFKGVFAHGVLAQFEEDGFHADMYGGSSSSVLSCSLAAVGEARSVGTGYWRDTLAEFQKTKDMSTVIKSSIDKYGPIITATLFLPDARGLAITVSHVNNADAAEATQGPEARRLGRKLLISAARSDSSWADENLTPRHFSNRGGMDFRLTVDNFGEVAYASTRMLHAWDVPAWISGEPYVDASYTYACSARVLPKLGYERIIAVSVEQGELHENLFRMQKISEYETETGSLEIIRPAVDTKSLGVDYLDATLEGLEKAYSHGKEVAKAYLDKRR